MAREIKQWITINGVHVPIFEGESKGEAVKGFINKVEKTKEVNYPKGGFKNSKQDTIDKNESPAYNKNWSKDDAEKYIANQLAKGKDSDYVILAKNGHHTVVKDWKEAREAMKEDSGWKHVKEDSDKIMKMADNLKTKQNVDNNEKTKQEQISKNEEQKRQLNDSGMQNAKSQDLYNKMVTDAEKISKSNYSNEDVKAFAEKYGLSMNDAGIVLRDMRLGSSDAESQLARIREKMNNDTSKTSTSYGSGDDKFKQDLKNLTTENLRAVHDNHNKAFVNVKTPEQKEWWDRTAKAIMDEEKRRNNDVSKDGSGKVVDSERTSKKVSNSYQEGTYKVTENKDKSEFVVRDGNGRIIGRVETSKEATRLINQHKEAKLRVKEINSQIVRLHEEVRKYKAEVRNTDNNHIRQNNLSDAQYKLKELFEKLKKWEKFLE